MNRPGPTAKNSGDNSLLGLLIKVYWMAFGNLPLLFIPLLIMKNRTPEFTYRDIIFIGAWALLVVTRLLDARFFNPVPAAEVKKYLVGLTAISAGMIGLGHIAAKLMG